MYAIKVSLPGYDVTTATPEQCAIHSVFNSPKIDATKENFLTFNIFFQTEPPHTAGTFVETILYKKEHGYNYTPQLWVHNDYTTNFGTGDTKRFGPGEAIIAIGGSVDDAAYVGARVDQYFLYVYIRKEVSALGSDPSVVGKSTILRTYVFADTAF